MRPINQVFKNTAMLFIFNIAKIIFPFVTLPYLTRTLSTDTYGSVAYIKTVMNYMQIIVDFGFVLSATKDIVNVKEALLFGQEPILNTNINEINSLINK